MVDSRLSGSDEGMMFFVLLVVPFVGLVSTLLIYGLFVLCENAPHLAQDAGMTFIPFAQKVVDTLLRVRQ